MEIEPNKRRYSRVPFEAVTQLYSKTSHWRCHLVDISVKGALVELPEAVAFHKGDPLKLKVILDESGIFIEMKVNVAHTHHSRVGLACEQIDADSATRLRRLIELNLGDPELFNRELLQLG